MRKSEFEGDEKRRHELAQYDIEIIRGGYQ